MIGRPSGRAGRLEQVLLTCALVALTALLTHADWLWRWDHLLYDASLRWLQAEPADRIVVVAIDEASLTSLGRWPWSRHTHARLVERLKAEGAKVIGLDILFAEPDRRDASADDALIESVRSAGNVVLPVVLEQPRAGAQLVEQLPLPRLADAAAALGHVHVELDADGLARGTHLKEGLGEAFWPALALAMLRVFDPDAVPELPGARSPHGPMEAARVWVRDYRVLIPFVGGPGAISRLSYVEALEGRHVPGIFKDRFVLVGATATGLGDALPTPVSGHGSSMPGVEINANLLHALSTQGVIRPLESTGRMLLLALIAALPVLAYARLGPRYGLLAGLVLLAGAVVLSTLLLALGRIWVAPAPLLATLVLSYPLWSWLRLETAMRYLRRELKGLQEREADTPLVGRPAMQPAVEFLTNVLPLGGWVLLDADGRRVDGHGDPPPLPSNRAEPGEIQFDGGSIWTTLMAGRRAWSIGARWQRDTGPEPGEQRLLQQIASGFSQGLDPVPVDSVEVVQAQIARLESGNTRLRALRRVIDHGLAQMADAVVLANSVGQVVLANRRAAQFLTDAEDAQLVGRSITELFEQVTIDGRDDWAALLRDVLVSNQPRALNARHASGRDLLIQLAPLAGGSPGTAGLILNASDISELKDSERRRGEMLSFLSHDLRSPLVSVLAVLELARSDADGERQTTAMSRVESYTRTTLDLAEQFLELVQAESQEQLTREEVNLLDVATNAMEQVWAQARAHGVQLESNFQVEEAWMLGDGSLLERVLVNLLSNAIRHNPDGIRVELSLERDDGMLIVAVTDNGRGIHADDLDHIFERFTRVTDGEHRAPPGSGLGLAFVKVVTERHLGRVDVSSVHGEGTCFRLSFPAHDLS